MAIRRTEQTTPDLFAPPTATKAPEPQVVPQGKIKPANPASTPRHLLPKDLAGALKLLDDAEIDSLLAAVTEEAKRRSWMPPSSTKENVPADARPQPRRAPTEDRVDSMTTGKLNAVRAAFKAGVKPSAIAREFGISQSDVRRALASEARFRESGR